MRLEKPEPLLLSRDDVAHMLGITARGLVNLERRGVFAPLRLGASVRYRRIDVEAKLDQLAAEAMARSGGAI